MDVEEERDEREGRRNEPRFAFLLVLLLTDRREERENVDETDAREVWLPRVRVASWGLDSPVEGAVEEEDGEVVAEEDAVVEGEG